MSEENEISRTPDAAKPVGQLVVAGILVVAVLIFVLQNTEKAKITWLFWDGQAAIWVVIVVSAVAGAILERLIAYLIRRKRRHPNG